MPDENLVVRVARFERTVATCLCSISFLFGAQCLAVALSIPVFERLFADFGSALPAPTTFVFKLRVVWLLTSIGLPVATLVAARKAQPTSSVIFSTFAGLLLFLLAQFVTFAAFLPILQLGSVAGGT